MGGMGGSSNESSSTSRPLTGPERAGIYTNGMQSLAGSTSGLIAPNGSGGFTLNAPEYQSPGYESASPYQQAAYRAAGDYQGPGSYQGLSGGDYENLQNSMLKGYTAGLDYAKGKDLSNVNQDLANRGIWSSGLATKAVTDKEAAYAPEYAKAGADATNSRYQLEQNDLAGKNAYNLNNSSALNAYNLNSAQMANNASATDAAAKNAYALQTAGDKNAYNANNAQQQYNSKWAPLNYLQGLWNGTGGAVSNSNSSSFGFQL